MRLINTRTFSLELFLDSKITPHYAILSHTWTGEEVSFQDMIGERALITYKTGFKKIQSTCRQAQRDGYNYVWVDTCCEERFLAPCTYRLIFLGIDKSSSSELSEAINSMFQWYSKANVCYVYLEDVCECAPRMGDLETLFKSSEEGNGADERAQSAVQYDYTNTSTQLQGQNADSGLCSSLEAPLRTSRWFKRGWTLQELIAPSRLTFFGRHWCHLGTLGDLVDVVTSITDIPKVVLTKHRASSDLSVARRMSWASNRSTTRIEDEAYSLLGIFGVYMPLLYGEGKNAFVRLQKEIIQKSSDQSIFAWDADIYETRSTGGPTYLASGVTNFSESGTYSPLPRTRVQSPYAINHRGLTITVRMAQIETLLGPCIFAILDCFDQRRPTRLLALSILPVDCSDFRQAKDFVACGPWTVTFSLAERMSRSRGITILNVAERSQSSSGLVKVRCLFPRRAEVRRDSTSPPVPDVWLKIVDCHPPGAWEAEACVCDTAVSLPGSKRWRSLYAFTAEIHHISAQVLPPGSETIEHRMTVIFWVNTDDVMFADVVSKETVAAAGSLRRLCAVVQAPDRVLRETVTEVPAIKKGSSRLTLFRIRSFNFDAYDTLAILYTPKWSVPQSLRQDFSSIVLTIGMLPWTLLRVLWRDLQRSFSTPDTADRFSFAMGLNPAEQPGDSGHIANETRETMQRLYGNERRVQRMRASENVEVFLQAIRMHDRPLPAAM